MGAYCINIQRELIQDTCPLAEGSCYWRHRVTGRCTYDPNVVQQGTSIVALAARVGAPLPDPEQIEAIREQLLTKVKESLSK